MKKKLPFLLTLTALSALLLASGCSSTPAITSIRELTSTSDATLFTVTYSDGTTDTLSVPKGSSNNSTATPDIKDIYEAYKAEYGEITFDEFLTKYFASENGSTAAIGKCLQSSMKVYSTFVEQNIAFRPGFGGMYTYYGTALQAGSAVIYEVDGNDTYVLTNYHVIYDAKADETVNGGKTAKEIYCYLYGSESAPVESDKTDPTYGYGIYEFGEYAIPCEYVGGSVTCDLAMLKVKTADVAAINPDFRAVDIADSYCVGETAIAIGNPEGEGISVTKGIVSVDNENIILSIDGTERSYRSVRIDTSLYSGNSGGGLFNEKGELIGITNAGNQQDQNINFAIPIGIVKNAADNFLAYAKDGDDTTNGAYKITVGVVVEAKNAKYVYDPSLGYGVIKEDVNIVSIDEGSIAEKMGIKAGDTILELIVNGKAHTLSRHFEISDLLLSVRAGDVIQFRYTRGSSESALSQTYTVLKTDLEKVV